MITTYLYRELIRLSLLRTVHLPKMYSYRNEPWAVATTTTHQTIRVGELVYSNLSGPFRTTARDESQYALTLVDDKSRITIVQIIRLKNHAPTALLTMIRSFEKTFNCRIAALQTNHVELLGLTYHSVILQILRAELFPTWLAMPLFHQGVHRTSGTRPGRFTMQYILRTASHIWHF